MVERIIVDREGMAAVFLARLAKDGCDVITVLRSNQYEGLQSFTEVGGFVPLSWDRQGRVRREVAPARYSLPLPNCPGEHLDLRVALVRDLRRRVPRAPEGGEGSRHESYVASPSWFDDSWIATASPSAPTELDPVLLMWWIHGRVYRDRLPTQRVVVQVEFGGARSLTAWLVMEPSDVSVCLQYPGFDTDLLVTADIAAFYRVWLGRSSFAEAIRNGSVQLVGPSALAHAFPSWLALSPAASAVREAVANPTARAELDVAPAESVP